MQREFIVVFSVKLYKEQLKLSEFNFLEILCQTTIKIIISGKREMSRKIEIPVGIFIYRASVAPEQDNVETTDNLLHGVPIYQGKAVLLTVVDSIDVSFLNRLPHSHKHHTNAYTTQCFFWLLFRSFVSSRLRKKHNRTFDNSTNKR